MTTGAAAVRSDVIVVGGGAIGCAIAYYLARDGAKVILLERGALAGEATGASAGLLAALSDEGGDRGSTFQQLCLDSLRLYQELRPALDATGVDLRYRGAGILHLALDAGEATRLRSRYEAQRSLAPDNRWLAGRDIRALEPAASLRAIAAMLSAEEHYLDAQRLTLALAAAAQRLGAEIVTNALVRRLLRRRGRVRCVDAGGRVYEAPSLVLAAGPWTGQLTRRLGRYVPVRPVRGQMLSLSGPRPPLRHVIWGASAYLVPREDGQTYVGASVEEAGFRKRTTAAVTGRLQRAAAELIPSLEGAPRLRDWAGLRPASPDGLPIMGLLPGWENVWVATGHFRNGILLAPITGRLIATSIRQGRPDAALEPFSAARPSLRPAQTVEAMTL